MTWYLFAILGAFFAATFLMLLKKLLKDINPYILASGIFLSTFLIMFLISIIKGIPEIGPLFYFAVLGTAAFNVIANILLFKALKITDLSLVAPIQAFTPAFLVITSFIMLREFPTAIGLGGIMLIVVGLYILNVNESRSHLLAPLTMVFRNRGMFYMLIVAFLFSISSNFDKLVVLNSDPIFGSSLAFFLVGMSFLIISLSKKSQVSKVYRQHIHKFFFVGAILAISIIAINIALTMQIVPYVISLKRLSILFSVFFGFLIFSEKHIMSRIVGAIIMISGTVLIIIFG